MSLLARIGSWFRTDSAPAAAPALTTRRDSSFSNVGGLGGGYFNPITGHGMPGQDSRMASGFRSGYMTDELAVEMWRGGLAGKIVSMLPKEAAEPGVTLTIQDEKRTATGATDTRNAGDLVEDVERCHRDLKTEATIVRACEWERLFGGSAIWAGANDYQAGNWAMPLNLESKALSIRWLDVVRSRDLTPVRLYTDPMHPKYGQVEVWQLSRVTGGGRLQQYAEIHESRLFLFRGKRIVDDGTVITQNLQSAEFGDGILLEVQDALRRFYESLDNTELSMRANGELIWQHEKLGEILANEGEDEFRKLVAAMQLASSILRARVVGADQTLTRQGVALTGLADLVTKFENELAAISGVPRTKLFGEAPGGLGNNATGPHGDWDETKATYRRNNQLPAYEWITKLIFRSLGGEPRRWKLEGKPYRHPTEQEQGAIVDLEAKTDIALSQAGLIDRTEVRARTIWRDRYALPDPEAVPELGAMPDDIRDPAALPPGEAAPADPAAAAPAPEGPKAADLALNGAQALALSAIVEKVAAGTMPRSSGVQLVQFGFKVPADQAEAMMPADDFRPAAAAPGVTAAPGAPPRTDAKERTIDALLKRLAPSGKCAQCGKSGALEVDHVHGRGWDPAELSQQQRADRYWSEYEGGKKMRALCRECNGRDGAKNKQGRSGPAHRADAVSTGEDKAFLYLPIPEDVVRQFTEVQAQIAPPDATLQEIDHVTLVYCPKNGTIPEEKIEAAIEALTAAAAPFSPLAAKVQGWAYFDGAAKDGQPATALVALLDAPGLDEIYVALKSTLKAEGFAPSDAHSFTPHFTICYLAPGDRLDDLPAITGEFTVDRVCFANRQIAELPLAGARADEMPLDGLEERADQLRGFQHRALRGEDRDALVAALELVMGVPCEMAERLVPKGPGPGGPPPDDEDPDDDPDEDEEDDLEDEDDEIDDLDDDLDDDDEEPSGHTRADAAVERDDCDNPLRQEEGGLFAGCAAGEGGGSSGGSSGAKSKEPKVTAKEKPAAPAKKLTPKQKAAAKAKAVKAKAKERAKKQVERAKAKIAKIKAKQKAAKERARAKIKAVKEKAKAKLAAAKEKKKNTKAAAAAKKAEQAKKALESKKVALAAKKAALAEAKTKTKAATKKLADKQGKSIDEVIAEAKGESPKKQEAQKKQAAEAAAKADASPDKLFVMPPPIANPNDDDDGPRDPAAYRQSALAEVAKSRAEWEKSKRSSASLREESKEFGEELYNTVPADGMTFSEDRFKRERETYADSLSTDEFDAAVFYTHQGDRVLNGLLRGSGVEAGGPEVEKKARDLDSAIAKYAMPEDTYVARGMFGPWAAEFGKRISVGDVFEEKGYTSTAAVQLPDHFRGEVNLRIKIPKGRNAAPVPSRYPHEDEFLLPRGSKFRVVSVRKEPKSEGSSEMVSNIEVEMV